MKILFGFSLAAALLSGSPVFANSSDASSFNLRMFERNYAQAGMISSGYDRIREVVPAGSDALSAIETLRSAGAHCQSPKSHPAAVDCYYRELLSVDDYTNTYATWDVRLDLDAGKVARVAVERTTEQHS